MGENRSENLKTSGSIQDLDVPESRKDNSYPPAISVIMPCYNVESYIEETMQSVLAQTFRDFEIICIDDGSTDGTLEIIKRFAQEHSCIRVYADTNHGQGYQRNRGIDAARGKYIYYMDSDDLLEKDCFENIYRCAEGKNLDLLFFEGTAFYESAELEEKFPGYTWLYKRQGDYPDVYRGEELYVKFRCEERSVLIVSPWLQLVRREYLIRSNIRFPDLPSLEDNLYTFKVLLQAKRVMCLKQSLYRRRVRYGSTMTKDNEPEKIASLTAVMQDMLKEFVSYRDNEPVYFAISSQLKGYFNNFRSFYQKLIQKDGWEDVSAKLPAQQWELLIISLLIKIEEDQIRDYRGRAERADKNRQEAYRKLEQAEKEKEEAEKKLQQVKQEAVKLKEELDEVCMIRRQQEDKLQKLKAEKSGIENSVSYRLGRVITSPFRKIKKNHKKADRDGT